MATPTPGAVEVKVRVKSASHRCEDVEISCPLNLNVKQVKQLIKEQYPLHPVSQNYKLAYTHLVCSMMNV